MVTHSAPEGSSQRHRRAVDPFERRIDRRASNPVSFRNACIPNVKRKLIKSDFTWLFIILQVDKS